MTKDEAWARESENYVVTAVDIWKTGVYFPFKTIWDAAWEACENNHADEAPEDMKGSADAA